MHDNLFNLRQLPRSVLENISKIVVNRIGNDQQAFMITMDIIGSISAGKIQQLVDIFNPNNVALKHKNNNVPNIFIEVTDGSVNMLNGIQHNHSSMMTNHAIPVAHSCVTGCWNANEYLGKNDANILGGMGSFILDLEGEIRIPVITANNELLAFYGSKLVAPGQNIKFESTEDLPITIVDVGKTYVDSYLMLPGLGEGAYIEYHNQPHFWFPLSDQCSGHVLLGREVEGKYYFTGFKIPYGFGLYTSPFVIHSDAFLIGPHAVVYTVASEYSTVILKDKHSALLHLQFSE